VRLIRVNNTVYIWLGLDNGNESQYPQVKIYEQDSATPIETVNLTHKVDGAYQGSFSYTGSDLDVLAVGIIYSDSGHTTENTSYSREIDIFHIDDSSTLTAAQVNEQADLALTDYDAATGTELSAVQSHGDSNWSTADISTVETKIDTIDSNVDAILIDVAFIKDIEGGRWKIDTNTNQMIFYKDDNTTEVLRVNLFDSSGNAAHNEVYERTVDGA